MTSDALTAWIAIILVLMIIALCIPRHGDNE